MSSNVKSKNSKNKSSKGGSKGGNQKIISKSKRKKVSQVSKKKTSGVVRTGARQKSVTPRKERADKGVKRGPYKVGSKKTTQLKGRRKKEKF